MNDTGPEATPPVDRTTSFLGLRREKLNPVPPPDWWIKAMFLTVSNMSAIESSTGSTKHADNCPIEVPAFIRVGEFGRNSNLDIIP